MRMKGKVPGVMPAEQAFKKFFFLGKGNDQVSGMGGHVFVYTLHKIFMPDYMKFRAERLQHGFNQIASFFLCRRQFMVADIDYLQFCL